MWEPCFIHSLSDSPSLLLFITSVATSSSSTYVQRGYILTHPLSRSVTACHSLSPPLIHKQQMCPHTRPQPPSLLDLLSYPRTPRGFPPSGDSFHVNTTSICGAALSLRTSIHRRAAYLSHLRGGKTNNVYIHPASAARIASASLCSRVPTHRADAG